MKTLILQWALLTMVCAQRLVPVPPGDPGVFLAFLRTNHAIINDSRSDVKDAPTVMSGAGTFGGAVISGPSPKPGVSEGWQHDIGIGDADFAKIDSVYAVLQAQLDALRSEEASYADTHRSKGDLSVLAEFNDRERALTLSAASTLRARMSPTGAAALFEFVDGKFRASFRRIRLGGTK
jgi:hypothetical protein